MQGCLEGGCSVVALCFDDHHRTHLSRFIMERAVESMVAGTTLVFKEESLRARSVDLNLTKMPLAKNDDKEKKDTEPEAASAKDKKAKKKDSKKRKEPETKAQTPKKESKESHKKQKEGPTPKKAKKEVADDPEDSDSGDSGSATAIESNHSE